MEDTVTFALNSAECRGWFHQHVAGGIRQSAVTNYVLAHSNSATVFVDVGARFGWFSVLAAARGARVIAFELRPERATSIRDTVALNDLTGCLTVVAAGIGAACGVLCYDDTPDSSPSHGSINHRVATCVPCLTLDAAVEGLKPTLLRIDARGFEANVLEGARLALSTHHPTIVLDVHEGTKSLDHSFQRVLDILDDLDYEITTLGAAGVGPSIPHASLDDSYPSLSNVSAIIARWDKIDQENPSSELDCEGCHSTSAVRPRLFPTHIAPFGSAPIVRDPTSGVGVREIYPAEIVDPNSVLDELAIQPHVAGARREFELRRDAAAPYESPPVQLLRLTGGWLETSMCVAITADGRYFGDTLRSHRQAAEHGYSGTGNAAFRIAPDRAAVTLTGSAVLVGLPTGGNYFHFLFESVPRWLLAADYIPDEAVLLTPRLSPMERSALVAAEAPVNRVMELPPKQMLCVHELFIASRGLRRTMEIVPSAARALRRLSKIGAPAANRRLLISRDGARRRRITNETDVALVAATYGFSVVNTDRMDVGSQAALFSEATAVMGLHGAGLANVAFAPPGCTVIELQPPGLDVARAMLYWNLSAASGHRYAQVICQADAGQDHLRASDCDVTVDTGHLDGVLARVLCTAT